MTPFVFVILLVLTISVGRTVREVLLENARNRPRGRFEEGESPMRLQGMQEQIDAMSSRLERLEEERDFYKDLLDAPKGVRGLTPPSTEPPTDD